MLNVTIICTQEERTTYSCHLQVVSLKKIVCDSGEKAYFEGEWFLAGLMVVVNENHSA